MVTRKTMLAYLAGVCLSAALITTGCAVPTAGTGSAGSSTETASAAQKTLGLKMGQPADYAGLKVTLLSAGTGPKDLMGKTSYKLVVKYENGTSEAAPFNEFDWKLEDAGGARSANPAIMDGSPKTLGSGELAPGGKTQATIYFQSPGKVAKVLYEPSFLASEENRASWTLK